MEDKHFIPGNHIHTDGDVKMLHYNGGVLGVSFVNR